MEDCSRLKNDKNPSQVFLYTRVNSFDLIELGMIQKIKEMDWTWFAVNLGIKLDLSQLNVVHAFVFIQITSDKSYLKRNRSNFASFVMNLCQFYNFGR